MLFPSTLPSTDRLGLLPSNFSSNHKENPNHQAFQNSSLLPLTFRPRPHLRLFCRCTSSNDAAAVTTKPEAGVDEIVVDGVEREHMIAGIGSSSLFQPLVIGRMSSGDQAFCLLAFIACTTSIAFASLVIAAVPTLLALKRAAISFSRLADTAREELPSTMGAIRLSGMEISDLTLELNELSEEIADGVSKSAQAVQAAEAGIRQIGALARQHTISMIQERANLPEISLRPMVAGAARKTSDAVGRAKKKFINFLSRGEQDGEVLISNEPEKLGTYLSMLQERRYKSERRWFSSLLQVISYNAETLLICCQRNSPRSQTLFLSFESLHPGSLPHSRTRLSA